MLSISGALDILNTPSVGGKLPRFAIVFATQTGSRKILRDCERTGHGRVNLKSSDSINLLCHADGQHYMANIYTITSLNGIPVQPD